MATPPSPETVKVLQGLRSEVVANGCLFVRSDTDRGYNQGIMKAAGFIDNYIKGQGIFQMADEAEAKKTPVTG